MFPPQGLIGQLAEEIAITQLSDVAAKSGTGTTIVFNDTPTVLTPTIASFANAAHNHTNAAGGAQLTGAAFSDKTGSGTTVVLGTSPVIATPDINAGTVDSLTSLSIRDTSAAFDVTLAAVSSAALTAGRTLTLDMKNAARSLILAGNLNIAGDLITSGGHALTFTTTGTTGVTLPTTGTLVASSELASYLLLAGRAGTANNFTLSTDGNGIITGSAASGGDLTLRGTTHGTKGDVTIGDDWTGNGNTNALIVGATTLQGGVSGEIAQFYRSDTTNGSNIRVVDPNAGVGAGYGLAVATATTPTYAQFILFGSSYSASGGRKAGCLNILATDNANGINVLTLGLDPISFRVNSGTTDTLSIRPTGEVVIGAEAIESGGAEVLSVQRSQNSTTGISCINATNGTGANAALTAVAETGAQRHAASLIATSTLYTPANGILADSSALYTVANTNGWQIITGDATPVTIYTNQALALTVASGGVTTLEEPKVTAGGGTVVHNGALKGTQIKVTMTFTNFSDAAAFKDLTICTVPAGYRIVGVRANTTTKFIGGTVATATLTMGISAGGAEFILSHDVFAAAIIKGDADADLGTSINRANAIQGGYPTGASAATVQCRLTVNTTTDQLTQGSVTFTVDCLKL